MTNRLLLICSLVAISGSVALYSLTHYTILSLATGSVGIIIWGSRQLVNKSLALTSKAKHPELISTEHQLELIHKKVSKCKFLEYVEAEGQTLAQQADELHNQYKNLKRIITQKFEPTELTFTRYTTSIDQVCLSTSENLGQIQIALENLNLSGKNQTSQWTEQREQARKQIQATEQALQALSQLFNSLNDITTKEKYRDQLDQSMQQIKELSERAKSYSRQ